MEDKKYIPEKDLVNAPDDVPFDILEIIIDQIKKCICKIKCNERGDGTGFFCIIPFPDKIHLLPILMTNNNVITGNDIKKGKKIIFTINNDKINVEIVLDELRKIYTNKDMNVTIIEIKNKIV